MRDWRALMVAALGLCFWAPGCKLDEKAFQAKVYTCNPSAADPACGTDESGNTMSCVPAHQLGGRDFCASSCDRGKADVYGDGRAVCLPAGANTGGAVLEACDPTKTQCSSTELSCLRTDMREDTGVCTTVSTCNDNEQCLDPTRQTCLSNLLYDTYGAKAQFRADHTYCLQTGCNARGSQCSPGESCLRKLLSRAAKPPDICVPNCDANQNCPPNYFCIPGLYSKSSPAVCIPGMPGFRCRSKLDCLVGDCVGTDAGFNICTIPCQGDEQCATLDSEQETFVCNRERGQCVGSRAFNGGICFNKQPRDGEEPECPAGDTCAFLSAGARDGICLKPCAAPGSTQTYFGVPHMCVPQAGNPEGPPVSLPTAFGNPCLTDDQCMGGLSCKIAAGRATGICTAICIEDADCGKNRFTRDGYCETTRSYCRPAFKDGEICTRDPQCESKSCVRRPGTGTETVPEVKECAKTLGW